MSYSCKVNTIVLVISLQVGKEKFLKNGNFDEFTCIITKMLSSNSNTLNNCKILVFTLQA